MFNHDEIIEKLKSTGGWSREDKLTYSSYLYSIQITPTKSINFKFFHYSNKDILNIYLLKNGTYILIDNIYDEKLKELFAVLSK